MIGTTGIHNLRVDAIVGIYPHEREKVQTLFLDIELDYDFGPAAASDVISDAVDYDGVASAVTELIQTRRFQLLEAMAEATAAMVLERVPVVQAVRLEIRKPAAVPAAASSFVRVTRRRA
ncbi:MAG: dihydroneopterin aldolase [Acidobacteria bacterium]|nr:dihydroneopterin aldolase [Acidobacteriota bacterium]